MHIPFDIFCKIQNKYCIAYLGNDLNAIEKILPILKETEIDVYLAVPQKIYILLENKEKIIEWEKINKLDFAHIEIKNIEYVLEILNKT